ncbi:hypothetical protein [Stenotrophomonas sp. UBA7606]|uniref:hypothetical protein n=1 Tax=Stenotrophomonas sp. UBA7606 TaxID=1947559 RepID=UPI0025E72CE9|nr:hypothetical protein [Stenotrophomonas sp. UBA7606]
MLIAIEGALSNGEIGLLVDEPVLLSEPEGVLCLTADQWSSLIQQRAAAGRPLHLCEVR